MSLRTCVHRPVTAYKFVRLRPSRAWGLGAPDTVHTKLWEQAVGGSRLPRRTGIGAQSALYTNCEHVGHTFNWAVRPNQPAKRNRQQSACTAVHGSVHAPPHFHFAHPSLFIFAWQTLLIRCLLLAWHPNVCAAFPASLAYRNRRMCMGSICVDNAADASVNSS